MKKLRLLLPFLAFSFFVIPNTIGQDFDWGQTQDSDDILFSIEGLSGPEAVRYDSEMDVYFVSNFNSREEGDGFITKADAEGNVLDLKFMVGTDEYPLNDPRGMFIIGEELFVADAQGVFVFNKKSGELNRFIDFSSFEPGFLNDISADVDGTLYVTDTGKTQLYRIIDNIAEIYIESVPIYANGITLDPATNGFVLGSWRGESKVYGFNESGIIEEYAEFSGGLFDGLEFVGENLIITSQADSTLKHYVPGGRDRSMIKTPGRPADIGLDTKRHRIAVPYIALDRVDVWAIPKK
ncbi:MAG: hypothetical protein RLN81_16530 [Balneolaceae bacterium]